MPNHKPNQVLSEIEHNTVVYEVGSTMPASEVSPSQAEHLVEIGVLAEGSRGSAKEPVDSNPMREGRKVVRAPQGSTQDSTQESTTDEDDSEEVSSEDDEVDMSMDSEKSADPDSTWSAAQLREYAQDNGILLGDATKKADILEVIRSNQS